MKKRDLKERILIIGCPGSGKTTFALLLGEKLYLPVIYLDKEFWHAGWVETPQAEWQERVRELVSGEKWIIDGNYAGTFNLRLKKEDTVIFLDFNRVTCLLSVLRRLLKNLGKTSPDLAENCPEKIDMEFIFYIWNFNKNIRPEMIDQLRGFKNKITICNRGQVNKFIKELD